MPRWRRSAGTQAIEMSEENSSRGGSPLKAMVSFFTIWQQDITQEDMDAICEDTPVQDGNGTVLPEDQPVITSIEVTD